MKSMAIVVAATAALLAGSSGAFSQEVCLKPFNQCMEACSKPGQKAPDSCFAVCERKNDQCSEKVFGSRREIERANVVSPEGKKAMAKKVVAPPPRKVDITPLIP